MYHWSLRTLCRRMSHFDIKYTNYDVDVAQVEEAVRKEIEGPGRRLDTEPCTRKCEKFAN